MIVSTKAMGPLKIRITVIKASSRLIICLMSPLHSNFYKTFKNKKNQ